VSTLSEATHVISWDDEVDGTLPQHLVEEFCRPIEIRPHEGDGTALVHWWYHPDSYDEWIPSQEVEANDPPEDPVELRPHVWKVSCRFIRDVEIFNEWGNELDYEIEDQNDDEGAMEANATGRKRKGRKSDEAKLRKKVDTLIVEAVTATEKMLQNLPPPTDDPTLASVKIVNINGPGPSQYELKVENSASPNGEKKKRGLEATEEEQRLENPIQKLKQELSLDHDHTVHDTENGIVFPPWYEREGVSAVERRYLPEILHCDLFGGLSRGSNPQRAQQTYLTIRNYIMDLYAQNPLVYLSATECRQKIAGDVSVIVRVHEFLDVFGFINYSPKIRSHSRPPKSSSFFSSYPTHSDIVKHCDTLTRLLSPPAPPQVSSSCNGHSAPTQWTPALDEQLLSLILAQHQSSSSSPSTDIDIDWSSIATILSETIPTITAKECFIHFVQMSLLDSSLPSSSTNTTQVHTQSNYSLEKPPVPASSVPSSPGMLNSASSLLHTAGSGRSSWGVSRKIRSVAALVVSECVDKLDYPQARAAIQAVNEVYQVRSPPTLPPHLRLPSAAESEHWGRCSVDSTKQTRNLESRQWCCCCLECHRPGVAIQIEERRGSLG
jgi:hypothetical protein